jgi:cellulose synthase/poly-beta-1,6-N-acetylglucosamine synthase-like glycosyltransferase
MIVGISILLFTLGYYATYMLSVTVLSRNRKLSVRLNNDFVPPISIVIPTYNEIRMIEKRVKNFDTIDYPRDRLEVIFVDGASCDGTPELIEQLAADGRPFIRVVRQSSRQGYNSAIYEGVCRAKSDIVVVGEAGGIFHEKALLNVVRHLADPTIGVATGKPTAFNPNESLATRLEFEYRKSHDELRYAESKIDSTPDMKGELLAFRKEIGLELRPRETLPDIASFDMAVSYMARSLGLRAIFDPDAIVYEYVPTRLKERMIVQIRRGTTFMGTLWSFRNMILNRKYGYFGLLILLSHFLILFVFPWLMLLAAVAFILEALYAPLLGIMVLGLLMLVLLLRRSRHLVISFIASQVVLIIASLKLFLGRHSQLINTVPTARR